MFGIGIISLGILIFFFLLKFIFKKHVVDRSHLIEITQEDEPQLFNCISEIVNDVETDFPKKIYLSTDVNAGVFYDSSFWSMIFPIRKNLQIGLGLVNVVNVSEFKAILAHEFGHFSQKSMKIGSYVYNVNQIIYNMLNDNESFNSMIERWSNISNYFAIFVALALKIIKGIQWLLAKLYNVINLNYMSLSREMEFHADEVAAHVTGSQPLVTSLLLLDLANYSFNSLIEFYNQRISTNVKTQNIYPQHQFILNYMAKKNHIPLEQGLPNVSQEFEQRFNKSKLVIKDQWASHPSTQERVEHLNALNIDVKNYEDASAWILFSDRDKIESQMTQHLFRVVEYKSDASVLETEAFTEEYISESEKYEFNPIYNGYYNQRNPISFDIKKAISEINQPLSNDSSVIFSNELNDLHFTFKGLESDIQVINQIVNGEIEIKTFDYDGMKYTNTEGVTLLARLNEELSQIKEKLEKEDKDIFKQFYSIAQSKNQGAVYVQKYQHYMDADKSYEEYNEILIKMVEFTQFMLVVTPYDVIENNLRNMNGLEKTFKEKIKKMRKDSLFSKIITDEIDKQFEVYILNLKPYFFQNNYNEEALDLLSKAISHYGYTVNQTFFNVKKELLDYQAQELL